MSVGYGTYFPSNAYGIDYYRQEVSETADFANSVGDVTCNRGQANVECHFDRRVALVTGLAQGRVYYYRVATHTVIGYGPNSTAVASPAVGGSSGAPTDVGLTSNEVPPAVSPAPNELSVGNCTNVSAGNCSNTYAYARNFNFTFALARPPPSARVSTHKDEVIQSNGNKL